MHFLHLTFRVRDFSKSLAFYEGFVGLKQQKRIQMGDWEVCFLADEPGATQIELVSMPEGPKVRDPGPDRLLRNGRPRRPASEGSRRRTQPLGHSLSRTPGQPLLLRL